MNADLLASVAGIVVSLVFSYVPGAKDWYGRLDSTRKRLVMAGTLLAVTAGILSLNCLEFIAVPGLTCDRAGLVTGLKALIMALMANQATYLISPRSR